MASGNLQKEVDQKFSFYSELAANKFGTLADMWDAQQDLSVTMIHGQNETDSPVIGRICLVISVKRNSQYGFQFAFCRGSIYERSYIQTAWQPWAYPHGYHEGELLLEATNVSTTATSYNCDWSQYNYLILRACQYGNTRATIVVPNSVLAGSSNSNRPMLYDPAISGLYYEIYKNGDNALYIRSSQTGSTALGVRIHGIKF